MTDLPDILPDIPTRARTMSEKLVSSANFEVTAACSTSKARVGRLRLAHQTVDTPVFMPVGTQGTLKGILPDQLTEMGCQILLGNTYHLGHRPGPDVMKAAGGLHKFMNWDRALLTDSGGFQMVSLLKLAEITEEGVSFLSPHDGSQMMLTPERSVELQNIIGADIIMQLDDVVHSSTTGARLEEAMHRTLRWLDRSLAAHSRPDDQLLFPIVQGGLDADLRRRCALEMLKRDVKGYAIGGLSGGEAKELFWRMVTLSTEHLPNAKPRYLMGVGYAVDLIVCVALGCDMFDCVFPTRTARFGTALVPWGEMNLKKKKYALDSRPIQAGGVSRDRIGLPIAYRDDCSCVTCQNYTRAYLYTVVTRESVACQLLSLHNVNFQLSLMKQIREAIASNTFPAFVKRWMAVRFPTNDFPSWVVEALGSVGINLLES